MKALIQTGSSGWVPVPPEKRFLIGVVAQEKDTAYAIQVGSFKRLRNAQKLKDTLLKKGYFAYIKRVKKRRGTFYRVKVGTYYSEREARAVARELNRRGYSTRITSA